MQEIGYSVIYLFIFLFARKHTVTYNNKLDSTYALTLCTILQLAYSLAGPLTHHSQHSLTHLMSYSHALTHKKFKVTPVQVIYILNRSKYCPFLFKYV